MKRCSLALASVLVLSVTAFAADKAEGTPLFNGKDLTGLKVQFRDADKDADPAKTFVVPYGAPETLADPSTFAARTDGPLRAVWAGTFNIRKGAHYLLQAWRRLAPESARLDAYGVIDGAPEGGGDRLFRVRNMVEKPPASEAPSDLAIIGRYILTPDIFDELEKTPRDKAGEIQLTNGMRSLAQRRPFFAYKFEGRRHDAGNKLGFLKATVEFALKREDLGADFRSYLKSLDL